MGEATMKGVFERRDPVVAKGKVFVLMPFSSQYSGVYATIRQCCEDLDLSCERADDDSSPGRITDRIYDGILSADILIADMTGRNPNVFYELGLAHAITDRVILLTQSTEDVPFDLKDWLHVHYNNTIGGATTLVTQLTKALNTLSTTTRESLESEEEKIQKDASHDNGLQAADAEELPLERIHLLADIAYKTGRKEDAHALLMTASRKIALGEGDADLVGNCAIEAESEGLLELAEDMYKAAIERDPQHINNRQSYVSFLLDHRSSQSWALDEAGRLLDQLEATSDRRERTRALRLQSIAVRESGDSLDFGAALESLFEGEKQPSLRELAPVLSVAVRMHRLDIIEKIVNEFGSRFSDSDQKILKRALADAYAQSEDTKLMRQAVAIYKELDQEGDSSPQMLHNLATVVFQLEDDGWQDDAMSYWTRAYEHLQGEDRVQAPFAQFLVRIGKAHEAERVIKGEPLR